MAGPVSLSWTCCCSGCSSPAMAAAVLELSPASPCAVCLVEGLLVLDLVRLLLGLVLVLLLVLLCLGTGSRRRFTLGVVPTQKAVTKQPQALKPQATGRGAHVLVQTACVCSVCLRSLYTYALTCLSMLKWVGWFTPHPTPSGMLTRREAKAGCQPRLHQTGCNPSNDQCLILLMPSSPSASDLDLAQ